ncbi:MAG: transcriptional repressor NrdR [Nitrospinae bacterium]|nr:transcriptional repressor NrdR [Nitrospinota bacterium]
MKCPSCGDLDNKVIDSRLTKENDMIRRRRECLACQYRFTTYERIEESLPMVVKKDGQRVDFDREKIRQSIKIACQKLAVTAEDQEALVERVVRHALSLGDKEISSSQLGEQVMEGLRTLDKVAYVRFASVYRQFRDPEEFNRELERLRRGEEEKNR